MDTTYRQLGSTGNRRIRSELLVSPHTRQTRLGHHRVTLASPDISVKTGGDTAAQEGEKNPTGAAVVFGEGTSSKLWRLEVSQVSNVAQRPSCGGSRSWRSV